MSTLPDRFFLARWPEDGPILLEGDEAKHAVRARRLGLGDAIELFDGHGRALLGEIREIAARSIRVERIEERDEDRLPACSITLATSSPKGERLDWLVEKATELGVRRLVLLRTERGVVDPRDAKMDRLRRLSIEACKQCGRNRLMEIEGPFAWSQFLRTDDGSVKLICDPAGSSFEDITRECALEPRTRSHWTFAIGPEGGFSDREIQSASEAHWRKVRLAPTILRIETAAIAAASIGLSLAVN